MVELVALNSRQFNNQTFDIGPVLLSSRLDVATCGGLLLRLEVESMNAGATITLVYQIYNSGILMGGSTTTITQPARYEIVIGRSDMDNTTSIIATVSFVNRSRINAVLYSMAKDEDVQPWL